MSKWSRFKHRIKELAKWFVGISTPSGSRWGIFAFLLAISFFLCEGSGMLEALFPYNSVWANVPFVAGIVFGVVAIILGILWLARGSKDTTTEGLKNTNVELRKIGKELKNIKDILKQAGLTKDDKQ